MDLESTQLISKVTEILWVNKILEPISDISVKDPNLREEGMGSLRHYVTVKFENPDLPPLNLFAKTMMKDNAAHSELHEAMKSFEKESRFLTKYIEAVKQLCKNKSVKEDIVSDIYPKCYYGDNEMLLLENIVLDVGYVILGKTERHDYDTAMYTLKTLATHHAFSYAMIEEEGGAENFFKRFPNLDYESFNEVQLVTVFDRWLFSAFNVNIKLLESNVDTFEGAAETVAKLKNFMKETPSLMGLLTSTIGNDDDRIHLLNHGDCWYGNMMFLKDNATNKILGHKLLDFQFVRYNSPATDIAYYLFTSVETDVRQTRLKDLLQGYIHTFNQFSNDLGHPTNLDYDSLLYQYRKKRAYGFLVSFIMRYGPGLGIFKDTDMSQISMTDWPTLGSKLATDWIADNPEESKYITTEIIKVVKEYFD